MVRPLPITRFVLLALAAVPSVPLAQIHPGIAPQPSMAFPEGVTLEWARQYMSEYDPEFDLPFAMAVDASGNAHVTGAFSGPHDLPDMVTIKYDSAGDTAWVGRYNGPGDSWDNGRAIAVDSLGNVYLAGWTHSEENQFDYVTIKYSASGAQQWVAYYNNTDDRAMDIVVDASGNVFVTGSSYGNGTADDYATVKYNSLGEEQWVARYNGPGNTQDRAAALALDAQGNVYVTGASGEGSPNRSDYVTIKYDPSGVQKWVGRYSEYWDYAAAIDVDASANVYVTGYSYRIGTYYDYATVKYNTMGVQQWVRRFNGPGTSDDLPYALKVDASGNVLVTGDAFFEIDHGSDYGTVKYSPSGVELWVGRYEGPGNAVDIAFDLAIDAAGDVYVTGGSRGADLVDDYATVKYSASGVEQWTIRHSDEGEIYDIAAAIGVDGAGGVYVTGSGSRLGGRLCTTVKYRQDDASGVREPDRIHRVPVAFPNPVRVGSVVTVRGMGTTPFELFSPDGRRILRAEGSTQVRAVSPGVYLLRAAGEVQKLVVIGK